MTDERLAEIREHAAVYGDRYIVELLAEVDRLRAEIHERDLREESDRYDAKERDYRYE